MLRDTSAILEDITEAVEGWSGGAGPNLALTGIEPFNHPELDRIIRAATAAGTKRLRLDTNATALGTREVSEAVFEGGVRHVQFPLLGSTSEAHDMLTGSAGGFAATRRGVETFAAVAADAGAKVQVGARVPLCRHNIQDVSAAVATAAKAGASYLVIAVQDEHLDLGSAVPWIEAACDTGVVDTVWVEVEGIPYCAVTGWELHLACVYRRIHGAKAPVCATCPLNDYCGGLVEGASERTLSALRPPRDAHGLAQKLARGFHPLESDHE